MKVLLKILAAVMLIFGLSIALIVFLPDQQYQSIASKTIKYITDRDISIDELKTNRSLNPSIKIKKLAFANPSWATNSQMITAENVLLRIDLRKLFNGKLHVHDFSAAKLNVDLIKNEQGDTNWQSKNLKSDSEDKFDLQNLARLTLSKFDLSDAQIEYVDQQKKIKYRLELPVMQLTQTDHEDTQRVSAQGLFNGLPFSVNGKAGLIDSLATKNSLPFNLETVLNESTASLNGKIETGNNTFQLTTSIAGQTNSLSDLSVFSARELPSIGPINISADVSGNLKAITQTGIDIKNLNVNVDDPSIDLNVSGELSGLASKNEGDVKIDLDVRDLSKLLKLVGLNKELPGTLKLQASAEGKGENFGLEISKAIVDSEFLQAELSGNIKDLLNGADAEVEIKTEMANLDIVTHLFGSKMPSQWGPINATAKLIGKNKQYALKNIEAELSGNSKAKISGSIEQLIDFDNMQLDAQASLATLAEISAFTPSPLPDIGPITATGMISWQDGKLALSDAIANYSGEYGNADVTGSIGDLIKFDIVRLKANASVPNLAIAEAFSGIKMPNVGQIKATADLVSPTALDLSAKNLAASYDHNGVTLNAVGSIDSLIKKRADLNLNLEADVNSLTSLNSILKTDLPKFGPLSAKANLRGATKNIRLDAVQGLIEDKALRGTIKGNLGNLIDFKGIDLTADVMTPSLQLLLDRFDVKTDIKKPAALRSHFEYLDGAIHLAGAEFDMAGNKIIGDLSVLNYLDKSERPKITGEINILNFDVLEAKKKTKQQKKKASQSTLLNPKRSQAVDIVTIEEVDVENSTANQIDKTKNSSGQLIPNDLLPFHLIRNNDLDLKIKIGRLRANVFDFENATVTAKSNNGVFQFGPFDGRLGGGHALLQLDVNANTTPALTSFNARIERFDMAKAGAFRDSNTIESSGDAFTTLAISGYGESIASILGTANGGGFLYFEDMLIKNGTLDFFATDLFKKTLNAINPFKKKKKDTQINCAGFAFKIKDGLFSTPYGVAAEAKDYSMTGNGQVNFATEAIDLEFKTKVKKLLAINPFEKLTGLVKVKGELASPVVTLNPKGIFEIGATVGAAIATGGLSLLAQDQYEKMKAKSELCVKALGPAG